MRKLTRSLLFLLDHAFRGVAASASFARLLDLVSRDEPVFPSQGDGRTRIEIPDLGYRPSAHVADLVPLASPRRIRAWHAQWKPAPVSSVDGLGYQSLGGFYLPRAKGGSPRPALLILPVLYDPFNLGSGALARYFASQGFAALEVRSGPSFLDHVRVTPTGSAPTWEEVVAGMIVDGRRALDWLCARPEVDAKRLGIVGVSHGAIVAPCVLGADPRLRAGVFCMGGADQAMIVARSREPSVRRFRRRWLTAHGLSTPEDLLRVSRGLVSSTEPLRYAPAIDPRAVLLFKTRLDRAIVPEAQDKLWEALGRPRRVTLPLGHISFGLAFYYAARRAAEFLRARLSTAP